MADILISKFTTQIPRVGATPATPGFAESEGQDPVAPSGTPQVYTPVTIGSPANGLSISGTQVLTIGLASTSATGALSSTDWNTFNGKIGGSIASGQVAFGTGVNTVGGNANFIYDSSTRILRFFDLPNGGTVDSINITRSVNQLVINTDSGLGGSCRIGSTTRNIQVLFDSIITRTPLAIWQAANGAELTRQDANGNWGFGTNSPTNRVDVNGTARIRTISNLGSAATSVLVPSATGVVSLRTLAELASDGGFGGSSKWTDGTGFIFRDNPVMIGRSTSKDAGAGQIQTFVVNNKISFTAGNTIFASFQTLAGVDVIRFTEANASVQINPTGNTANILTFGNITGFSGSRGVVIRPTEAGASLILTNTLGTLATFRVDDGGVMWNANVASFGNVTVGSTLNAWGVGIRGFGNANASRMNLVVQRSTGTVDFQVASNGELSFFDGGAMIFGTTTGMRLGTATNQRLAFYGSTPIVKPSGDILTALSNLGLITSPTITQVDQFAVKTTASADQTLPSGVLTILDYDTTLTNNSTATYTVGTNGRITINTTGIYTITAGVVIEADAVTALESAFLGIFRNGDLVAISSINTTIAAGAQSGLSTSTILSLTATDIIDCRALVNSVGGVANGLARRLGTLLGANATQVNSLSITKNSM